MNSLPRTRIQQRRQDGPVAARHRRLWRWWGRAVRTFDQGNARYRLQVFISADNLTNHANYLGYSGVTTSPFFGQPTTVTGMRKIDAGINLSF